MDPAMQVVLRPGAPDVGDGLAFARYLDDAQERWFRAALGRRAHDVVAESYVEPGHEFSYEYVTFAEVDGSIVGAASGYSATAHRGFTNHLSNTASGWRRLRLTAFSRLSRRVLRFIDTVSDGDFYVRAIAVSAEHRDQGIGTALMRSLEDRARAAGSKRLALDVAAKNRRARLLYERFGLVVDAESPRWFGLPNSNVLRMVKPI